jgi:FkbM family methyltransferase
VIPARFRHAAARRLRRKPDARAARTRFIERAAAFTPYVTVENDDVAVVVSTTDRKMAKYFAKGVRTEQRVLHKALTLLESAGHDRPGGTFIDAGANIGTSAFAALARGFSFVVACEPEPENARLLRTSVALNGFTDVVAVREVALSDHAGSAPLGVSGASRSKARVLAEGEGQANGEPVYVRLVPLDDLAAGGVFEPAAVGMLWLDVEGHEVHVLAGASRVLEHSPPLVMELSPQLLHRAGKLDELPGMLAQYYTHVADLRHGEAELRPVAAVVSLIEQYEESHTDLLTCRVPS